MFYHLLYPLSDVFSAFNLFKYITFRSFGALMTSLLIYLLFGKRFIAFLQRLKAGQFIREEGPEHHQVKGGTPTMGGILIVLALSVSTLLWSNLNNPYVWTVLFVLLGYGALGFIDDYLKVVKKRNLGLRAKTKFSLQAILSLSAGFLLIEYCHFSTELHFPFLKDIHPDLGYWYLALIFLVIVGTSNAVNLTDGLDGLVTGPNIIAFGAYGLLLYVAGNAKIADYLRVASAPGTGELTVFCASMMGALIGFLWFNSHPAQVFMGDVGSLSIGAVLGTVALIAKAEILLILIGGIFVLETVSVITQVLSFKLTGKRIFRMAPLHHHFELKGWSESKVIVRFWIISLILAILSLATLKIR
ncbi:MAG: phospho-N-acetylmuramoyl-pentapeptide-transferase [Deltaproteobacteria bacterium]|nr:phospho-N-acetylmuramoyl-pentapeptide-transferase [Deltaproteobacteria bacterium]